MIPCGKCGHVNKLGTVFCHGCGQRLEITPGQVVASVTTVNRDDRDHATFRAGRSAMTLCSFVLVCALILRYVMVPDMPPPDLPLAPELPLFQAEAFGGKPAPSAVPAVSGLQVDVPDRFAWRRGQGRFVLRDLGVDVARVAAWQKAVRGAQLADGRFPGADPAAATGLATLALQAWPADEETLAAAARARAQLKQLARGMVAMGALGRALTIAALADAGEADDRMLAELGPLLVDGKAARWQLHAVLRLPPARRPADLSALQAALTDPLWGELVAMTQGRSAAYQPGVLGVGGAAAQADGEGRLAWATAAWMAPVPPQDLSQALAGWIKGDPAPVSKEIATACGAQAASALAVLACTAPVAAPPTFGDLR